MKKRKIFPCHLLPPSKMLVSRILRNIFTEFSKYHILEEEKKWKIIHDNISHYHGQAKLIFNEIVFRSNLNFHIKRQLGERTDFAKNRFLTVREVISNLSPEKLEEVRKRLEKDHGVDKAGKILDFLETDDFLNQNKSGPKQRIKTKKHNLRVLQNSYVFAQALLAKAEYLGNFMLSGEVIKYRPSGRFTADRNFLSGVSDDFESFVSNNFRLLYDTLSKNDYTHFLALVSDIHVRTSTKLGYGGMLLGSYLALVKKTADSEVKWKQLLAALRLQEQMSLLALLHIWVSYLHAKTANKFDMRWFSNEYRRAQNRKFLSVVPQGKSMSLEQLRDSNELKEDDLVKVEGEVLHLRIEDDPKPPKFSTLFTLKDFVTNATIVVRAHMFSLINNGLTNGAFCRVNGFVRYNKNWIDGPVGLDIDRVSLTECRKTSWTDDVAHRMKKFYTLFRDEMHMSFTPNII